MDKPRKALTPQKTRHPGPPPEWKGLDAGRRFVAYLDRLIAHYKAKYNISDTELKALTPAAPPATPERKKP